VIWTRVAADLVLGPFYWFGGEPGDPLPPIADYPNPLRPTRNRKRETEDASCDHEEIKEDRPTVYAE
jgi:hypothetical protein